MTRGIGLSFMVVLCAAAVSVPFVDTAAAQAVGGGYIVHQRLTLPDSVFSRPESELPHNPNRMDVKAVGMGRTQLANGRSFNAMMDNPALLARKRFAVDLPGLQLGVPKTTLDAARFVEDNQREFTDGDFYTLIDQGYNDYRRATTVDQRLAAIAKIKQGLVFPNELIDELVGSQEEPNTHGLNLVPSVQAQWGRWGLSLYATGQVGFSVKPGESIDQLLTLDIPANADRLTPEQLRTIGGVVNSVFDANGNLIADGLPQAFAMTYMDMVGAVGYAHSVRPDLDVGANIKVIHRLFSTKNIDAENLDDIVAEARADLEESVTGFTADLGALYHLRTGTDVGVSVQNLIPIKKLGSEARFNFVNSAEYYLTDNSGNKQVGYVGADSVFHPYAAGDTLIGVRSQHVRVDAPYELTAPLLINAGVCHPLRSNWVIAADWVDILAQDDSYDSYLERFRLGTEYRLLNGLLALRGGVADKTLTLGTGLSVKVLQVDAAYAYDRFVDDRAYMVQLKLGW